MLLFRGPPSHLPADASMRELVVRLAAVLTRGAERLAPLARVRAFRYQTVAYFQRGWSCISIRENHLILLDH